MPRKTVGKKARVMPGKEQILDATGRLFARHGFYGMSAHCSAAAAQVSHAARWAATAVKLGICL